MAKNLIPNIFFDSKRIVSDTPWEHSASSFGTQKKKYTTYSDEISVSLINPLTDFANDCVQFHSLVCDEINFSITDFTTNTTINIATETFEGTNFYPDLMMPFFVSGGGNASLYEEIEPDLKWGFQSTIFEGRYAYPESDYTCLDEIQFTIADTNDYGVYTGNTVTLTTVPFWS
jgi:hypothetical protein